MYTLLGCALAIHYLGHAHESYNSPKRPTTNCALCICTEDLCKHRWKRDGRRLGKTDSGVQRNGKTGTSSTEGRYEAERGGERGRGKREMHREGGERE